MKLGFEWNTSWDSGHAAWWYMHADDTLIDFGPFWGFS